MVVMKKRIVKPNLHAAEIIYFYSEPISWRKA